MSSLLIRLDGEQLLLDGGVGSELSPRGGPVDLLNATAPDLVRAVHARYAAAGSDVLTTNTFLAQRTTLEREGLGERAAELAKRGAQLAREVADAHRERPLLVLGSLGPGTRLLSRGEVTAEELRDSYAEAARALLAGRADGLLLETVRELDAARAALEGLCEELERDGTDAGLVVSLTPDADLRLACGTPLADALAALESWPIDLVAINCVPGPEALREPLEVLSASGARRRGAYPNAGKPRLEHGRALHPIGPEAFAVGLVQLAHEHGLALIGGCCGTTPAHIAQVAALFLRD